MEVTDMGLRAVPQQAGVRPAFSHVTRAISELLDFVQLKAATQKHNARRTGFQFGLSAVMGLFLLAWAELSIYLALGTVMAPHWAALLAVLVNGIALAGVNLFAARSKRRNQGSGATELKIAKDEMIAATDCVFETANHLVREKFVDPFKRYRTPLAITACFVTGLVVARALFPSPEGELRDGDVRDLI